MYSDASFAATAGAYTPFVDCPAASYEVVASDGKGNVSARSAGDYFRGTGAPGNNQRVRPLAESPQRHEAKRTVVCGDGLLIARSCEWCTGWRRSHATRYMLSFDP